MTIIWIFYPFQGDDRFTLSLIKIKNNLENALRRSKMLEVTPAATEQIAGYFTNRDPEPIRIFLNEGG